jgi:ribosome-associated protein
LKSGRLQHYLRDVRSALGRQEGNRPLDHMSVREAESSPLHLVADASGPAPSDILSVARATLDDMKAEEAVEIDLRGRTSIADSMIVASGRSQRHVASIAEKLIESLKANGHGHVRVEGMPACDWVLIDAGDLIVHIFRPESRGFYNLEKIWGVDRPVERVAV